MGFFVPETFSYLKFGTGIYIPPQVLRLANQPVFFPKNKAPVLEQQGISE